MANKELIQKCKMVMQFMGWTWQIVKCEGRTDILFIKDGEHQFEEEPEELETFPLAFHYHENWNVLIEVYNACLNVWTINRGFPIDPQSKDSEKDGRYTLAKHALLGALSPGIDNQMHIQRAFTMICDFIQWYFKEAKPTVLLGGFDSSNEVIVAA